jgi:hypothetical protein
MTDPDAEITLPVDWRDVPIIPVGRFLAARITRFRWLYCLGPVIAAIIVIETLRKIARETGNLFALGLSQGAATGVVVGILAFLLASLVVNNLLTRSYRRSIEAAPMRRIPSRLHLSSTGVRHLTEGSETAVAWNLVSDVVVHKGTTLVLMSPVDYIPIPHISLPPGLSPESLLAQIAAWRAAAAPSP